MWTNYLLFIIFYTINNTFTFWLIHPMVSVVTKVCVLFEHQPVCICLPLHINTFKRNDLPKISYQKVITYLNINIKSNNKAKNVATLSIVRNITMSCRCNAGIKRTSFSIRSNRNVRRTDKPLPPSWFNSSTRLKQ